MGGTAICGLDIGGTDIKLCLAVDGRVVRFMEYDWFPAAFTQVDEIIDPILLLVRLMRLDGARACGVADPETLAEALAPAFARGASLPTIAASVLAGERLSPAPFVFDAIGLCFPDVVVRDKIVGGEVYKTRGMRDHLGAAYEREFRRLSALECCPAGLRAARRRGRHRQRWTHGRLHRRRRARRASTPPRSAPASSPTPSGPSSGRAG